METELFVHFAEIAGVFVGFGALISTRSSLPSEAHHTVYLRGVLELGVWVIIAALVPIALWYYGVEGPKLWRPCALLGLVLWAILVVLLTRTPESREIDHNPDRVDRFFPIVGLPLHVILAGSLLLILLGRWPAQDGALYVTALTTGVVFAGYTLLTLVLSQHAPE